MKIPRLDMPSDCRVVLGDKPLLVSSASYSQDKMVLVLQRPFLLGEQRLQARLREREVCTVILAMRGVELTSQYAVRLVLDMAHSTDGLLFATGTPPLDIVNAPVVSATPCTVPDSIWSDENMTL